MKIQLGHTCTIHGILVNGQQVGACGTAVEDGRLFVFVEIASRYLRRKGIGTEAARLLFRDLKRLEYRHVHTRLRIGDKVGLAFAKHLGFEQAGLNQRDITLTLDLDRRQPMFAGQRL